MLFKFSELYKLQWASTNSITTIPSKQKQTVICFQCIFRCTFGHLLKNLPSPDTESKVTWYNEIDIQGKKLVRKLINMLEFLIDNIVVMFSGRVLSTDSRHTYGFHLCSSSRRLVPLFVWGRLHTGASQEKRKEALISFFAIYIFKWCPFNK